MSNIVERSIRLTPKPFSELDNFTGNPGEIFLDANTLSLRIFNGKHSGGYELLRADLSNINGSEVDFGNKPVTAVSFTGPLTGNVTGNLTGNVTGNLTGNVTGNVTGNITGNVTGNLTGNVTGNVTGNLTGNISGNAATVTNGLYSNQSYNNPDWLTSIDGSKITGAVSVNALTATTLATARTINGVSFNGSASITVPTIVNGSFSVSLASNGNVTVPNVIKINTAASIRAETSNVIVESIAGDVEIRSGSTNNWTFSASGSFTAPGDITTTGAVTAESTSVTNTVTAGSAVVNAEVTVGANVNIPTTPTQTQHATNKGYVDSRSLAMSIALS